MTDETPCHCLICVDHGIELDDFDRRTISVVRAHGWNALAIPADDSGPGWAYTIGLWHSFRSPEVAIFGIDDIETMQACLNILGEAVRAGDRLVEGAQRDDVIEDHPITLKPIHPSWYKSLFGMGLFFYRRPPLPFLEVVWPDSSMGVRQPQLWIPKAEHPPGPWPDLP
ncbi:DUF4262 domain-containing protein [Nonomuraea soli]|uniref:DUF4262 domain-containing protein n=1 Tax=Nonomuraea soli TaxID=1032476 RepID=A0A7W0CI60_9ACTN|nr:DUF4262 domain-containing protein [Nonomuraea soli]MBA2891422.1 hypothetical protein [Nonomuraea soli]